MLFFGNARLDDAVSAKWWNKISPNGGTEFRQMGERISAKWGTEFPPNGGTNFRQMGENCCEPGLIVLYCQYKLGGDNQ